ncbi:MAG: hypothetical protein AAGI66_08760, partial [Cyanobacteria bacterium P01_H01_bin.74]
MGFFSTQPDDQDTPSQPGKESHAQAQATNDGTEKSYFLTDVLGKQGVFNNDRSTVFKPGITDQTLKSDTETQNQFSMNTLPTVKSKAFSKNNTGNEPFGSGAYINSMDVDLPGGLENYLPTQTFRLRIRKKRLEKEIQTLKDLINQYDRRDTVFSEYRLQRLTYHLKVLESQNRRTAYALLQSHPLAIPLSILIHFVNKLGTQLNRFSEFSISNSNNLINKAFQGLQLTLYGNAYSE